MTCPIPYLTFITSLFACLPNFLRPCDTHELENIIVTGFKNKKAVLTFGLLQIASVRP